MPAGVANAAAGAYRAAMTLVEREEQLARLGACLDEAEPPDG